MQLDILKRIAANTPKEQVLALYNAMTNETATQEEIDKALTKPKKSSLLTIEKDLLNSYCEAVADMKRMRTSIKEADSEIDAWNKVSDLLDECIDKHAKRISDSDVWR